MTASGFALSSPGCKQQRIALAGKGAVIQALPPTGFLLQGRLIKNATRPSRLEIMQR